MLHGFRVRDTAEVTGGQVPCHDCCTLDISGRGCSSAGCGLRAVQNEVLPFA